MATKPKSSGTRIRARMIVLIIPTNRIENRMDTIHAAPFAILRLTARCSASGDTELTECDRFSDLRVNE